MPQVKVKFWEHPVERTEEEIEELRRGRLLADQPEVPGQRGTVPEAPAPATAAPVKTDVKPDIKEKQ